MSAIITEKFRKHNADQFHESFSEASANAYYLFIGKATAFTSSTTTGSDSSPPTPADAVGETQFYAWDSMLAAKKITSSDIQFAIPRRNWVNGTTYSATLAQVCCIYDRLRLISLELWCVCIRMFRIRTILGPVGRRSEFYRSNHFSLNYAWKTLNLIMIRL